MKKSTFLFTVFISLLLYGCPYESNVPLTSNAYKIDEAFLGKWIRCSTEGVCDYLNVVAQNNYEYAFTYKRYNHEKSKWIFFSERAFLSKVNRIQFLNIVNEDSYTVKKIQLINGKLYLKGMNKEFFKTENEELISFNHSNDFCNYVNFLQSDKDFYLEPAIYRRKN